MREQIVRQDVARLAGLSAIVPTYNCESSIRQLVSRLEPVLRMVSHEFELVLVNDGSRDRTWEAIEALRREHPWIRSIDFARNCGQHNALLCGIRSARYPYIVTLDDDLQDPPEEIPKMLAALGDDVDVVYRAPATEVHGLWRDLASQVTKAVLQGVLGAEIARTVGPFRVFRTTVRQAFDDYRGTFVNIDVLLTWLAALRVVRSGGLLLLSEATVQGWERLNARSAASGGLATSPCPRSICT